MTATPIEAIPAIWDDSRDSAFFRITARLFSGDFCLGATVLLASYDVDETTTPHAAGAIPTTTRRALSSCR